MCFLRVSATNMLPARRKKTRCPGEKPSCSFCLRLGQRCTYNATITSSAEAQPVERNADLESRLNGLEDKLDRLIDHIRYLPTTLSQNEIESQKSLAAVRRPLHGGGADHDDKYCHLSRAFQHQTTLRTNPTMCAIPIMVSRIEYETLGFST